jgi:hypothetical protein
MKGDRYDLPSIAGTFGGGSPFYLVPFSNMSTLHPYPYQDLHLHV